MWTRVIAVALSPVLGVVMSVCGPKPKLAPQVTDAPSADLWQDPADLELRDTYNGPWGAADSAGCDEPYSFVGLKTTGASPGYVAKDSAGRVWHIKQPAPTSEGAEGPIEVVLSRVLSAVGYHQPPVYFLPAFSLREGSHTRCEVGGRFRLETPALTNEGAWQWDQNPFVGSRPYQGLLVILMMFNSSDLKDENNTVYTFRPPSGGTTRWYVVRDLGTALGETGKLAPRRGNVDLFEREAFIVGEQSGFVEFNYRGLRRGLIQNRIRPADVRWATDLLSRLSDRQWSDAFRAGGYEPGVAGRFIRRLRQKVADGLRFTSDAPRSLLIAPGVLTR